MRIVAPGDLDHSMLHVRINSQNPSMRMPPIGSNVVDSQAVAAVAQWIRSLQPSKPAATAAKDELKR